MNKPSTLDSTFILREHVLRALALNRMPGFHFPGFFLGLSWDHVGKRSATVSIQTGLHCVDCDGSANVAAVALLADHALSCAMRAHLQPGVRMVTVTLHLQFTGVKASGNQLVSHARLEKIYRGASLPQGICRGDVCAKGTVVCYTSGTFVGTLPLPGVAISPLPWQRSRPDRARRLNLRNLNAKERTVVRAARTAIRDQAKGRTFIQSFWGQMPVHSDGLAGSLVDIGPHMMNRVGHVQGGVLVGMAVSRAIAALPHRTLLTGVSAWFLSPGEKGPLRVESCVLRRGRNISVVRSKILGLREKLVLEVVSSHAPPTSRIP